MKIHFCRARVRVRSTTICKKIIEGNQTKKRKMDTNDDTASDRRHGHRRRRHAHRVLLVSTVLHAVSKLSHITVSKLIAPTVKVFFVCAIQMYR